MYLRTDYTFNPTARTITFTNPISLEEILRVVNVTSGTVIYDAEGEYSRGTLVGNVLTLTEDTTGMSSEDVLSIQMVDVGAALTSEVLQSAGLATSAKQDTLLATQYIDVVTTQTVNTSGISAQSAAAVNANTKMIAVTATKACWILLGSNPTATVGGAGCIYLGDGQTYFPLKVTGGVTKVAVIQDSIAGKINIVESA